MDNIIDETSLVEATQKVTQDIINETDVSKIRDLTDIFNVNIAKKNALRVLQMNNMLDKISEQLAKRVQEQPDAFSNKDLLDYFSTIQTSIDKTTKGLGDVDMAPTINLSQHNNTVNVMMNTTELTREEKQRILETVNKILQQNKSLENTLPVNVEDNNGTIE